MSSCWSIVCKIIALYGSDIPTDQRHYFRDVYDENNKVFSLCKISYKETFQRSTHCKICQNLTKHMFILIHLLVYTSNSQSSLMNAFYPGFWVTWLKNNEYSVPHIFNITYISIHVQTFCVVVTLCLACNNKSIVMKIRQVWPESICLLQWFTLKNQHMTCKLFNNLQLWWFINT